MTLKQQIHDLVNELPDDSPLLLEVREALRMNSAIGEALDDVREDRTDTSEEFMRRRRELSDEVMSGKVRIEFPHFEAIQELDHNSPQDK
jgi:hypothetical protein